VGDIMNYYFKSVTLDKKSWYDRKTLWKPGAVIRPDSVDLSENPCGHGIHCSPSILGALKYQWGPSIYCLVSPGRIIASDSTKIRCETVTCICFLTKSETDKYAGFRLWEANHTIINPLLIRTGEKSTSWLMENLKNWDLFTLWNIRASIRDEETWRLHAEEKADVVFE
jgi:hypothetical protein